MPKTRYLKTYASRNIRGKRKVCRYLEQNEITRLFVPPTAMLSKKRLLAMLSDHGTVYVKPDIGSQGIGVGRVKQSEHGYSLDTTANKKQVHKTFGTAEELIAYLNRNNRHKVIVQAAIELDTVGPNERPYDIRSMVQRKPGGKWTCTGFLVKVGSPNKIVTNYYQGGKIWPIDKLWMRKQLPESERQDRINELRLASLRIARTLSRKRSGMHEMGIDFAYDKNNRLWVLEVNSNHPQFHPLKKIKPDEYKKMVRFARSYGRFDD
ncbi:YheC/YheD family protein [Paenibacillus thailandensis]|uniref:YheC/YheD family protein n=1 Tax=Paenibacillus thailandensis TaxID=393250 RepID=A0ABW5QWF2_9BACL